MDHLRTMGAHLRPTSVSGDVEAVAWSGSTGSCVLRPRPGGITPDDIIVGCAPLQTRSGTDKEAGHLDACVHACLEAGMVRFDTAPKYGDAEDVLGRGLANSPLGDTAIIYTKVGKYQRWSRGSPPQISGPIDPWVPFSVPKDDRAMVPDYSKAGAAQSMKESMDRMQVERCHTLRLHDPDSIEGAMELALDPETGIVAGLRELRAAGIIQNVSFGMNANKDHLVITPGSAGAETTPWSPAMIIDMIRAVPPGTFDSCLMAYGWRLFDQDGWPVMEECAKAGIKVHVAGVFGSGGLFAPERGVYAGSRPAQTSTDEVSDKVKSWTELAEVYGVSLGAVALAFAALPSVVDKVVIGMRKVEEVEMNIKCMAEEVPPGLWAAAQAQGLLSPDLPIATMRIVNGQAAGGLGSR